jgi:hypothetical protein
MITERAMLSAVHISIWTAVKHDRKVSRDVANQHGAHESAGRYNKQLLRGAERLDALRTLAGQIRQHFYKITLPWSDEGYRLLPAHFYWVLDHERKGRDRGDRSCIPGAFKRRRCLVPADAFFKWQKIDAKTKQPFCHRDEGWLALCLRKPLGAIARSCDPGSARDFSA